MSRPHLDGFDLVRIAAAMAVVVSHTAALSGHAEPVVLHWTGSGVTLGHVAVAIFFAASGFLVSQSWQHDPRVWAFACRRLLRMLPGLIVMLVLTVVLLGLFVSSRSPGAFFTETETLRYVVQNVTLLPPVQYSLPGMFEDLPYPDAVNGSLWTLRIEAAAYGLLVIAALCGIFARSRRLVLLACLMALVTTILPLADSIPQYLATVPVATTADLFAFFAAGAALTLFRTNLLGAVVAAVLLVATQGLPLPFVQYVAIPYLVIYLGTRSSKRIRSLRSWWGDPSYGIYIYAFPITQVMLHFSPSLPVVALGLGAGLFSLAAGIVSWRFVEAPALRFGKRLMRRSVATSTDPTPAKPGAAVPAATTAAA